MKPHILVPIDFSDASERALAWAADLARTTGGSVHLLHVVPLVPAAAPVVTAWVMPSATDLRELEGTMQRLAAKYDSSAVAHAVVAEDVAAEVVRASREGGTSLIVMATHGRGGVKRAVLGSVADYVARHADVPVVTVRGKTP